MLPSLAGVARAALIPIQRRILYLKYYTTLIVQMESRHMCAGAPQPFWDDKGVIAIRVAGLEVCAVMPAGHHGVVVTNTESK